tara:strand:+ start:1554 stop:2717 length:1164 start_codon:yes stop_codon:yes gene_type:complete
MVKKLEDYEYMCPEPFTNLHTGAYGNYLPCCVMDYKELYEREKNEMYDTKNHTIEEWFNSAFIKKLRKAFKENNKDFLKGICKNCIKSEQSGVRSHREWYLERFMKDEFVHKKEELEKIIHEESFPTFLHCVNADSIGGALCNLSCNMCNEASSTKWNSEAIKLKEMDYMIPLAKNYKNFYKDLEKFEIIEFKMTGGEPLLVEKHYEIMSKLSKDTIIRIITNGTVNPTRLIKILKDFKQVIINVSVEGVKEVSEYIRHGSNFDTVLKHYDMMQEVFHTVSFTLTINALNIARIPELLKLRKGHAGSPVTNNFYSVSSIPDDIKELYLNKLYESGNIDLIKYLESAKYNEEDMWEMLRHCKRRDRLRGTNLVDVFPEWKDYYETCNG